VAKKTFDNPELENLLKNLPCEVCGVAPPNDVHHLRHRGAGGRDFIVYDGKFLLNLITLCRWHHFELHDSPVSEFVKKYPRFKKWLRENDRLDVLRKC